MRESLAVLYRILYRAPLRGLYQSFLFRPLRNLLAQMEHSRREELAALENRLMDGIGSKISALDASLSETKRGLSALEDLVTLGSRPGSGLSVKKTYQSVTGRDIGNYFEQVAQNYRGRTNPFSYYQTLVDALVASDRIRIRPLYELMGEGEEEDCLYLGLRHDIDADPVTGLRAARYLARQGVCGSFYLLHTASYYGEFHQGLFVRNPRLVEWVRGFIVAGCELGLHNDALGAHQIPAIDGIRAVETEIEWLRSQGAVIRGTVGHNSAPSYGAENSEIFQGRRLWARGTRNPEGELLPTEAIVEQNLGLTYEGTFAVPKQEADPEIAARFCKDQKGASIHSEEWMKTYLLNNPCCDWGTDYQFWLIGKDEWVAAGRFDALETFEWKIGLERLLELIARLPTGSRSVCVIHPVFFQDDP